MRNRAIRSVVYLYFATGVALMLGASAASVVRFGTDKGFAAWFLVALAASFFAVLAFASWGEYARPLSVRKWIVLCALATLGFVNAVRMTGLIGGTAG